MKKTILFLFVAVGLFATSCKKDHVCSCTDTSTEPGSAAFTYDITIKEAKKADAANKCVKTTYTDGGFTYTSDCKLK